jgi:integrase/recombinase XerD
MARTVSMSMKDWPAIDLAMWAALTKRAGPLDGNGGLAHVRATTLVSLRSAYERWLAWILRIAPAAITEAPEARATPERLLTWLASMEHLALQSQFSFADRTVRILSAAAPDADWSVQHHILRGLRRRAKRVGSPRKAGRILSSGVLLDAGRTLAGPLADGATTPLAAALLRRDGTMVAFLALLPLRRRALSELKLGQSVLVDPTRITIALSGDMTKNGHPWEAAVQTTLEPLLQHYIDEVRPWLLARGGARHDMLWVGQCGQAIGSSAIALNVARATLRTTGKRIPPHFFRDAAASTLARQSPGDARLIRPLLAHSGFGTAERHYIQAQAIETGRDFASVIARLTEGAS